MALCHGPGPTRGAVQVTGISISNFLEEEEDPLDVVSDDEEGFREDDLTDEQLKE